MRAQIALDEVLCAKERADWFSAPERTTLLKSWVTGKADEYHARAVLSRFYSSAQADELCREKAIELNQVAALNKDWRNEDRRMAVNSVGSHARRMVDHQVAYEWLFDQMRNNPDLDTRRVAANVVGSLPPLHEITKNVGLKLPSYLGEVAGDVPPAKPAGPTQPPSHPKQ